MGTLQVQTTVGGHRAPTIKGVFVQGHIREVQRRLGEIGLAQLEDRFGGPLDFGKNEDVPTEAEARLLAAAADLLAGGLAEDEQDFEAGRLHYQGFTSTYWCKVLFSLFPRDLGFMVRHATGIAEKVFRGVSFENEVLGPHCHRLTMTNGGYPLPHFQGLLQEWMDDFGHHGHVEATQPDDDRQEFLIRWQ